MNFYKGDCEDRFQPFWLDEKDWLCAVEFLPKDDLETQDSGAEVLGYLFGYAQLTDTRTVAVVGDSDAEAYEILFSFISSSAKEEFFSLVRNNPELGEAYIEDDLKVPSLSEIKDARPLGSVLPADILNRILLVSNTVSGVAEHISAHA